MQCLQKTEQGWLKQGEAKIILRCLRNVGVFAEYEILQGYVR